MDGLLEANCIMVATIWEFPKVGDLNTAPQNKVPLIFGNFHMNPRGNEVRIFLNGISGAIVQVLLVKHLDRWLGLKGAPWLALGPLGFRV